MSIADDLEKLKAMHDSGALTADEFSKAKATLLNPAPTPVATTTPPAGRANGTDSLADVARSFVKFHMIASAVALVIAAVIFFVFILPKWREFDRSLRSFNDERAPRTRQFAQH